MAALRIETNGGSRCQWDGLLARAPRCSLQQGWAYGEALAVGGIAVQRLLVRDGRDDRPLACAQLAQRRLLGLVRAAFLLRGPVWLDGEPDPGLQGQAVAAIRAFLGRSVLVWAPESATAPPGWRPVVTGYSTSWLDLAQPLPVLRRRMRGTWRHRLGQAERRGIEVVTESGEAGLRWLLACNEAHRRKIGYRGPSPAFLRRVATAALRGGEILLLVAYERQVPLAGVLMVSHGVAATYEVGHVTPRGRELCAKHLLLWRAIGLLAARGVRWLDLGGIDTLRAPGLARFKLGLGGEVHTLAGTFVASPFATSAG